MYVFRLRKHSAAVLLTIGPQSSGSTYVDYANTWFNPVFHCQGKIIQVCSTGTASLRQKNWDRATISSLSRNTFQIYENRSWEGALLKLLHKLELHPRPAIMFGSWGRLGCIRLWSTCMLASRGVAPSSLLEKLRTCELEMEAACSEAAAAC